MHIVVTDVLACPRCGGDHGLIVLAERMEGRDVVEGSLGCANCRETYAIHGGVALLRRPGAAREEQVLEPADDARALRFAALLGLGDGSGTVLAHGASAGLVEGIQRLLPHALLVGSSLAPPPASGVESWAVVEPPLPFRPGSLRGMVVAGAAPPEVAVQAARLLAPGARLVVDPAPPGLAAELRSAGMEILLEQDGVAVASGRGPG
jgi:uncharacterized protein YbaR (Trm112 family)